MAFSAIDELARENHISGIAFSTNHPDLNQSINYLSHTHNLKPIFLQKATLSNQLLQWINETHCDAVFVIGCSYKIPKEVLNIPKHGFINFHPGSLPEYRGPDPAFWVLKNGEDKGTLTAHIMSPEWDSGNIIEIVEFPISRLDNYNLYSAKYSSTFPELFKKIISKISKNEKLTGKEQDENKAKYYSNPKFEDLLINFRNHTAYDIEMLTSACSTKYGGSFMSFQNAPVRVFQATSLDSFDDSGANPGTVLSVNGNNGLVVKCKSGAIKIDVVSITEGVFSGERFAMLTGIKKGFVLS